MAFPWALARLLPSAVRVRIRSRSTSAKPPNTVSIKRPVLAPVSAHGSAKDRNCALASTMRLTIPKRSKGAARQPVDPCHRHHVAGSQLAQHPVKLAPVGPCARHLFAVDVPAPASGGAKLVKLAVEGLPVGGDTGIWNSAWKSDPAVGVISVE
jgi:hypothetical protein